MEQNVTVTVTITSLLGEEHQVLQPQTSTIRDLKQHIVDNALFPGCDSVFVQRLLSGGAALEDDAVLSSLASPISLTLVIIPFVQCPLMNEFLVSATQTGDASYIEEVLATPIHPDNAIRATDSAPVLCVAAHAGRPGVVDLLLAARADVDRAMPSGETAAQIALRQGHAGSLQCLLAARADVSTACSDSIQGHSEVLKVLISARADAGKEVREMDFVPISAALSGGNQCRLLDLQECASFAVSGSRFGVKLGWDAVETNALIDLDLQAVAFDSEGTLVDAVYYNRLVALDGTLEHTGDELTNAVGPVSETVWLNLLTLPCHVHLVFFVIARAGGGYICDAPNGSVSVYRDSMCEEVARFNLKSCQESVFLLGVLIRGENSWLFWPVREHIADGQHFMDVLEPAIGNVIRRVLAAAPRKIRAAFAMQKGTIVDLPKGMDSHLVVAGLGWDTDAGHVDLDVSVVLFTADGSHVDTVFYDNLEAPGIKHSGDNMTGDGGGDDETISLHLDAVSSQVQQMVFVVNIYTKDRTFKQVTNPYCRLYATDEEDLCKYGLTEAGEREGLIIARLVFEAERGRRWSFQAAGQPCSGRTWKESMPELTAFAASPARQAMA